MFLFLCFCRDRKVCCFINLKLFLVGGGMICELARKRTNDPQTRPFPEPNTTNTRNASFSTKINRCALKPDPSNTELHHSDWINFTHSPHSIRSFQTQTKATCTRAPEPTSPRPENVSTSNCATTHPLQISRCRGCPLTAMLNSTLSTRTEDEKQQQRGEDEEDPMHADDIAENVIRLLSQAEYSRDSGDVTFTPTPKKALMRRQQEKAAQEEEAARIATEVISRLSMQVLRTQTQTHTPTPTHTHTRARATPSPPFQLQALHAGTAHTHTHTPPHHHPLSSRLSTQVLTPHPMTRLPHSINSPSA